ncbi:hypothetical protein CRUP_033337, partial [Coryphaenoides rupestris]
MATEQWPVFVFDGKPPGEKLAVLERRAETAGWSSPNRSGTVSSQTKDCLQLLSLLGVPIIQAPGDGEALCARLVSEGIADAVASEDMDTLPFGGGVLIRQLNAKKDSEVIEYSLPKILEILKITQEEFVDLCILLGCDYCDKISGLGPKRALKLIQEYHTIEEVVQHVNRQTHRVPQFWKYKEARKLFLDSPRTVAQELAWTEPDEEGLVRFLCHDMHVKEPRVRGRMEKFRETREKRRKVREEEQKAGVSKQTLMGDFFRVTRKRKQWVMATNAKRKQEDTHLKMLREMTSLPPNRRCFDCDQRGPTYANMTVGSFVCTTCSGILRGLHPPHRVKSISMTTFTQHEIEFLQKHTNEVCKHIWLGLYDDRTSVVPDFREPQKVKEFLQEKYEKKRWYVPPDQARVVSSIQASVSGSSASSTGSTPEVQPLKTLQLNKTPPRQSPGRLGRTKVHNVGAPQEKKFDLLEVIEYSLPKILEILKITQEEFVDLCILLGCDYCDKISGLGPKRALKLIQEHHTIEEVVQHVNRQTHRVPQFWKYKEARKLFLDSPRTVAQELAWTEPDEEGLVRFLCHDMHVKEPRVRGRMEKFRETREKRRKVREEEQKAGVSKQTLMGDFFRVTRKRKQWVMATNAKRKQEDTHLKMLREMTSLPPNRRCFDCDQRGPTYANMTVGSFVCTTCSGILRGLHPPHRVKSISMTTFTQHEIEFLQKHTNEDMDTLPFGGGVLIRQLNAKKDSEVIEYSLPKILEILKITQEEFVDLCILLGCDYCDKISGLGPKRALKLIQEHHTIEEVVLHVNRQTYRVPQFWKYKEARKLFLDSPRTVAQELAWTEPDEEGLVRFLCHDMHVKEPRIRGRMEKFREMREKRRKEREEEQKASVSKQTHMGDFFRVTRKRKQVLEGAESVPSGAGKKRNKSKCFDCDQRGPTYANMTVGSFVCTTCSGILRGLHPPHRVKSISMTTFTQHEIEFLQKHTNEVCKHIWLGLYDDRTSVVPDFREPQKVKEFLQEKYEKKRWYVPPDQARVVSSIQASVSGSSASSTGSTPG